MASGALSAKIRACADACAQCLVSCEACARHCIEGTADMPGMDMAENIKRCRDCATLCGACLPLLARQSDYYAQLCELCAVACEACASACENMGDMGGDVMRQQCAEDCRRCAQECRSLVA